MFELPKRKGREPAMMMDFGQKARVERQLREMWKGNVISMTAAIITVVVVLVSLLLLAVAGSFWYIGYLGRAADAVRDSV